MSTIAQRIVAAIDAEARSYGAGVDPIGSSPLYGPETDMPEQMWQKVRAELLSDDALTILTSAIARHTVERRTNRRTVCTCGAAMWHSRYPEHQARMALESLIGGRP